jgi:hypothetical protein
MKDFLDKGMAKCPYKTKKFWDDKIRKEVEMSIVCPESAWTNELICLRNDRPVSELTKCPRNPRKAKPVSPVQSELPGMPTE